MIRWPFTKRLHGRLVALPRHQLILAPKTPAIDANGLGEPKGVIAEPPPQGHVGNATVSGAHLPRIPIRDRGGLRTIAVDGVGVGHALLVVTAEYAITRER